MTKIAIITDTHWGCRSDHIAFLDYFEKFYQNVFFPYLVENDIKHVFHLGDIVDRRKFINYVTLRRMRETYFEKIEEYGFIHHMLIGNHDVAYKNTNEVNSMQELFGNSKYKHNFYDHPCEVTIDNTKIAMLPWVCSGNYQQSIEFIEKTDAQILFGHLELQGFEMYKGVVNHHGMSHGIFEKFDLVASGHFHHRSQQGNIVYLGAPYEMTWSDHNDERGFHVLDLETRELTFIQNPYKMFVKVFYDDAGKTIDQVVDQQLPDVQGAIVKVVVVNKSNPYWFDRFITSIEKKGPLDLQVVDAHLNLNTIDDDDIISEAEDTMSIIRKYAATVNTDVDGDRLIEMLNGLYNDALQVE